MDNVTLMQYFEWYLPSDGTFWQKVRQQAPELRETGITALWLPPAYKGAGGGKSVGYDVYDMYDLGEFDQKGSVRTKYGTRDEYLEAVNVLHANGISVLADTVFNQMMGADEKEKVIAVDTAQTNREQQISGPHEIEAWTRFTFPGRAGAYSTRTWNRENFSGTDYDAATGQTSIYLFDGKRWNDETDSENVNFDYLMGVNLDMDSPDTCQALLDWGRWYFDTVHPDGLRLDAVKHISFEFYREWLKTMRREIGRDFFTVGEYWSGDLGKLLHYLNVVVDGYPARVPDHRKAECAELPQEMEEAQNGESQSQAEAAAPDAAGIQSAAGERAGEGEAAGLQDGSSEQEDLKQETAAPEDHSGQDQGSGADEEGEKLTEAELEQQRVDGTPMTLFDVPLHFQFLNAANDGHGFNMAGLFSGTLVEARPECAVTFVDNHDTQPGQSLQSYIPHWFKPIAYAMILLRNVGIPCVFYGDYYGLESNNEPPILDLRKLIAIRARFAYGTETDYFDDHSIIGFTRSGDEEHQDSGLAVLATAADEGTKYMVIGRQFAGCRFYDALGRHDEPVVLDENGGASFHVHGGYVSVWLTESAYRSIRIRF